MFSLILTNTALKNRTTNHSLEVLLIWIFTAYPATKYTSTTYARVPWCADVADRSIAAFFWNLQITLETNKHPEHLMTREQKMRFNWKIPYASLWSITGLSASKTGFATGMTGFATKKKNRFIMIDFFNMKHPYVSLFHSFVWCFQAKKRMDENTGEIKDTQWACLLFASSHFPISQFAYYLARVSLVNSESEVTVFWASSDTHLQFEAGIDRSTLVLEYLWKYFAFFSSLSAIVNIRHTACCHAIIVTQEFRPRGCWCLALHAEIPWTGLGWIFDSSR